MMHGHHKLSQKSNYVKRYGRKFIDDKRNIQIVTVDAHMSEKGIIKYNEREYCNVMEILKCEFCTHYFEGFEEPCLPQFYEKTGKAANCRNFNFDKNKFKQEVKANENKNL